MLNRSGSGGDKGTYYADEILRRLKQDGKLDAFVQYAYHDGWGTPVGDWNTAESSIQTAVDDGAFGANTVARGTVYAQGTPSANAWNTLSSDLQKNDANFLSFDTLTRMDRAEKSVEDAKQAAADTDNELSHAVSGPVIREGRLTAALVDSLEVDGTMELPGSLFLARISSCRARSRENPKCSPRSLSAIGVSLITRCSMMNRSRGSSCPSASFTRALTRTACSLSANSSC